MNDQSNVNLFLSTYVCPGVTDLRPIQRERSKLKAFLPEGTW